MTHDHGHSSHEHVPHADDHEVPELETDQSVAPRPEEEIADALRAEPGADDDGEPTD